MEYLFKIQIKGITDPPVWRKVIVPVYLKFLGFHHVIQIAFGWGNCHLFDFRDKDHTTRFRIGIPSDDDLLISLNL